MTGYTYPQSSANTQKHTQITTFPINMPRDTGKQAESFIINIPQALIFTFGAYFHGRIWHIDKCSSES